MNNLTFFLLEIKVSPEKRRGSIITMALDKKKTVSCLAPLDKARGVIKPDNNSKPESTFPAIYKTTKWSAPAAAAAATAIQLEREIIARA